MDLTLIKQEIKKFSKAAFNENNIAIKDEQIDSSIKLFFNILTTNTGYFFLDGIASELSEALQRALVNEVGKVSSLKAVAVTFDSFAKKIIVMAGLRSYSEIGSLTMMPLFKIINIISSIPNIDESTIELQKGDSNGLYIFGTAYLTRNKTVHNSPDWDMSEVVRRTKYTVALFILIIIKLREILLVRYPDLSQDKLFEYGDNKESQIIYDFISYSKPTNKIKNQVVNSFIVHTLYNEGPINVSKLCTKIVKFAEGSLTENASMRMIQNLFGKQQLIYNDPANKIISLADEEYNRVRILVNDYNDSLCLFTSDIEKIIIDKDLKISQEVLIKEIGVFFEKNFNIDISEATDQNELEQPFNYYQELIEVLKTGGIDDKVAEEAFKYIIEICRKNDIIIRISAGRIFSKLSNPDSFGDYVRSLSRDVFLDTQILLYILCINPDFIPYDNIYFRIAKNIVDLNSNNDRKFSLKVSKHYLSEIIYQLKQALFLIQFTEISNLPKCPISTNVFYLYFYWLQENNGLPDDVDSFGEFMFKMFNLEEDDAFSKDYESVAMGVLECKLYEDFGIEISNTPTFEVSEINSVQELYSDTIKKYGCEDKKFKTLQNDSIQCLILFNHQIDTPDPFFLTWDKSFSYMRIEYKNKFKRGSSSLFFHLFSPAKFVNHVDLVNFRINANTLSDDLLSLIESHNFKTTTYSVIDIINKFLDIPCITAQKRKAYTTKIKKEIYKDDLFSYDQMDAENHQTLNRKSFTFISQQLFDYFKDNGTGATKQYRNMLLEEEAFETFITIVSGYMNDEKINDINVVFKSIEKLINKYTPNSIDKTHS